MKKDKKLKPSTSSLGEHPHPGKKRWPVTAGDSREAIKVAKTRPWWPLCLNQASPFTEHGRWWFITDENPAAYIVKPKKPIRVTYVAAEVPWYS